MSKELFEILSLIEQLEEVEIEGFEPMTSVVEMDLRTREDVVTDGGHAEDIVVNAPEQKEHFFVVPKVIE